MKSRFLLLIAAVVFAVVPPLINQGKPLMMFIILLPVKLKNMLK